MLTKRSTTEKILNAATTKLAGDITALSARRDSAVGVFRQTLNELDNVNLGLKNSIEKFDNLAAFITEQKSIAEAKVSDNEKIRAKIVEIIGE
jgi:hypothetical protein